MIDLTKDGDKQEKKEAAEEGLSKDGDKQEKKKDEDEEKGNDGAETDMKKSEGLGQRVMDGAIAAPPTHTKAASPTETNAKGSSAVPAQVGKKEDTISL